MIVFLVGRAVQGLGAGLVSVGLYVLIARVYPDDMRPRVFTVMTSAWVVPALVGPALAAIVADYFGWRWVFLGVPVLALAATVLLGVASRAVVGGATPTAGGVGTADPRRVRWAATAAAGVLIVNLAGQRQFPGWPTLLVVALAAVTICGARLLPPRSWRGGPGLPSVIGVRGLLGAGFFAVEVYLPLTLVEHRGLTPAHAGLVLTVSAVAWFTGAWLATHLHVLDPRLRRVRLGAALVAVGIGMFAATLVSAVPVAVALAGWAVAGAGMGMAFATLSALLLQHSAPGHTGVNSSAMHLNDALVQSSVIAVGGVAFASLLAVGPAAGVAVNLGMGLVAALGALLLTGRIGMTDG